VQWSTDPPVRSVQNQDLAGQVSFLERWWLSRMARAERPLTEKMALFWHGHFATSVDKVTYPGLMLTQNQIFRTMGLGNFEALVTAVSEDPAMLVWLDTRSDVKAHPNENFARELMELFTLGLGNYTETDVREAARAFTGWTFDSTTFTFKVTASQHDNGIKTVRSQTGNLSGQDVIHQVTDDPGSARFVAAKVWSHFAYPVAPSDPVLDPLVAAYGRDLDIAALVRSVFLHPAFRSPAARTGLVKTPVEYVVGVMRALNLAPEYSMVTSTLSSLGQVPFHPPSVAGWPRTPTGCPPRLPRRDCPSPTGPPRRPTSGR
jgi:uncharacterized protein (DUF1800 family)